MEITAVIPKELVPVLEVYKEQLQGLSLWEALLALQQEFPRDDPEHIFPFRVYDGFYGWRTRHMSIGARIRIFFHNLMSRPVTFQYRFEDVLAWSEAVSHGREQETDFENLSR